MSRLVRMRQRLLVGLLAAVALGGCGEEPSGEGGAGTPVVEKIDGPLRDAMRDDARVPVLVLARDQLFEDAAAFAEFTTANAGADRRVLRGEVIATLKSLAARSRPALTPDGAPAEARVTGLWIVNAVSALLTRAEIEALSARDAVRYLFLLPSQLPPPSVSGSTPILAPVRAPFAASGKSIPWNLAGVGAAQAWAQGVTGEDVVIAAIDEAIAVTHPDLAGSIWVNDDEVAGNGVDDDDNGYVDDRFGYDFARNSPDNSFAGVPHGTYVAGIMVGDGTSGIVTGVAPDSRLMPLIASGVLTVAHAVQYALDNGADVLNMSFSIPNQRNLRAVWRLFSEHAVVAGMVLTTGAGNFQQSAPLPVQLRSPEDIPAVIAVGGVDESRQLAPYSSMGPVEWGTVVLYGDHPLPGGLIKPDVVAFPGPRYPILNPAGGYIDPNTRIQGNSFSGPHAAGAAALLLSKAPHTPAWRIGRILQQTAIDIGPAGKDNATGAGLLDIPAALARLD